MKYSIDCIGTNAGSGWRYRALWCGKVSYNGQRTYERHQDAERAAKATGATAKAEALYMERRNNEED